jgi:hypothetical protein
LVGVVDKVGQVDEHRRRRRVLHWRGGRWDGAVAGQWGSGLVRVCQGFWTGMVKADGDCGVRMSRFQLSQCCAWRDL